MHGIYHALSGMQREEPGKFEIDIEGELDAKCESLTPKVNAS
jgi:hypothetical protein